ncbi:MAG: cytidine deaminase [Bacteroidales bacterium]|nr:MAG: cytidine deaminase [Bacteroidales bacterium]
MKIVKESGFRYSEYTNKKELSTEDIRLIENAVEAQKSSYSPYSNFKVGAAIQLENGEIIQGSNQENGSYPSGLCAERVALFYAGVKFPNIPINTIAITASFNNQQVSEPLSPCGACRQVMIESRNIGNKPMRVILVGKERVYVIEDVTFLLPFNFSSVNDAVK